MSGRDDKALVSVGRMWLDVYRRHAEGVTVPTRDPRSRPHPLHRLRSWRAHGQVGRCQRCRYSWLIVEPHLTMFTPGEGSFPLCEGCWQALTPDERLPHYDRMLEMWQSGSPTDHNGTPWDEVRRAMHEAVLAGG